MNFGKNNYLCRCSCGDMGMKYKINKPRQQGALLATFVNYISAL